MTAAHGATTGSGTGNGTAAGVRSSTHCAVQQQSRHSPSEEQRQCADGKRRYQQLAEPEARNGACGAAAGACGTASCVETGAVELTLPQKPGVPAAVPVDVRASPSPRVPLAQASPGVPCSPSRRCPYLARHAPGLAIAASLGTLLVLAFVGLSPQLLRSSPPSPSPSPPTPPDPPSIAAPPSTPLPRSAASAAAAVINARFLRGGVSDAVSEVGVFVHQVDSMSDGEWSTSAKYPDRMASAVVSARAPYMFSTSAVGFVLRPWAVDGLIWCAYGMDGATMRKPLNHGCDEASHPNLSAALEEQRTRIEVLRWWGCFDLCCIDNGTVYDRSGCRYNEVVLNGPLWMDRLPNLMEAIFYPTGGRVDSVEGDRDRALAVRDHFHEAYSVWLPLLVYDVGVGLRGGAPFRADPSAQ